MVTFAGHIPKYSSKSRYTMQKNNYKRKLPYTLISIAPLFLLAISSPAMATNSFFEDAPTTFCGDTEAEAITSSLGTSADKTLSPEEITRFLQTAEEVIGKNAALSEELIRTQEELRRTQEEQADTIAKQQDEIAFLRGTLNQNEIVANEYKALKDVVFNIFCLTCVIAVLSLARVALLAIQSPKNAINQRAIAKQQ